MQIAACLLALLALPAPAAMAAEITVHDEKSAPESMAVAPDGTIYAGSATSPFIYRVPPGGTAQAFVDVSAENPRAMFLGQLVDAAAGTLWACHLVPVPGTPNRRSSLRGYDLKTGAEKLRWNFPGDASACNDFTLGPDGALYITDTANASIFRLPRGAAAAQLFLQHRSLAGVDGITFLDGTLYVNCYWTNNLYRIPVDAAGTPGTPVDIWMDAPLHGPDGMRAANGKLFVAENAGGRIDALTVTGDTAHVTVLRDGLKVPTGIEPAGTTLWFTERGVGKVWSMPMPR